MSGNLQLKAPVRLVAVFILVAGSFSAAIAQSRNSISGFVFTPDRRPVPQVYVELMNDLYQVLQRTRTDGSGRYFFGNLSSGRFMVKVLPFGTGFEEQSQEVELVTVPRPGGFTSDQAFRDIYLRPRVSGSGVKETTGTVFAQEVPAEARKLYERGVSELERNQVDAGIRSLVEAATVFPEYYLALERLGREYLLKENFEFARAVYIKLVSVNEKSYSGWYGLAYSSYALKDSAIAVEAATKATVLDPGSPAAFLLLGISYRSAKDYPAAEKALLKARSLSKGKFPDVHWNLALLYANNLSRYKEAADELELYLASAPEGAKVEDIKKLITRFREKATTTK